MGQKILIIEDQPVVIKLLKERFKKDGYQVVAEMDGKAGLAKAKSLNPDLIITDMALPGMVGSLIARTLKTDPQFKHIPIIVLSAFVHGKEGENVEFPADAYITKTLDGGNLFAKVEELLKGKKA